MIRCRWYWRPTQPARVRYTNGEEILTSFFRYVRLVYGGGTTSSCLGIFLFGVAYFRPPLPGAGAGGLDVLNGASLSLTGAGARSAGTLATLASLSGASELASPEGGVLIDL